MKTTKQLIIGLRRLSRQGPGPGSDYTQPQSPVQNSEQCELVPLPCGTVSCHTWFKPYLSRHEPYSWPPIQVDQGTDRWAGSHWSNELDFVVYSDPGLGPWCEIPNTLLLLLFSPVTKLPGGDIDGLKIVPKLNFQSFPVSCSDRIKEEENLHTLVGLLPRTRTRVTAHLPSAPMCPSSVSQGPASSWPGANTTSVLRLGKRIGRVVTVVDDY